MIERGAIITTGDTLRLPALDEAQPEAAPPTTLADAEREHILRALESADWHVKGPKGAAAALGLNPATLYSRMNKLGIRPRRQSENGSDVGGGPPEAWPGQRPGDDISTPGTSFRPFPARPGGRTAAAG